MKPLRKPKTRKGEEPRGDEKVVPPSAEPSERIWFFPDRFAETAKGMAPDEVANLLAEVEVYAAAGDVQALKGYSFVRVGDPVSKDRETHAESHAEGVNVRIARNQFASVAGSVSADRQTMEYAQVLAHAVDTFGSRTRANAWLNRPSRIFNNQSPLQILTQDPAAVEEELVRIDHGMFL